MKKTRVVTTTLKYNDPYKPYNDVELRVGRKFARVSLNGQYRRGKSYHRQYRQHNPGWLFGTEGWFFNWTHFKRHCWHFSINWPNRGITFSYGKRV